MTPTDHSKLWISLIAAISSVVTAYVTASYTSRQASQEQEKTINRVAASTAGPLENGQKLCRVLQGKTWRDGLIVPQNWNLNLCVDYMKKTGGTAYQLGCIYTDGTNLGKEDGSFPSPNCGWR